MKKLLLLTLLTIASITTAQNIDYTLEWNEAQLRYEVFITRDIDATVPFTNSGVSRITVVFPTDGARTLSPTSQNVDAYSQLPKITAPSAQPGSDFHTFTSNGGNSLVGVLNGGVKTLWVTFTSSDGCVDGARLYINGSDPDSAAGGMNGSDRSQGFSTLSVSGDVDEYRNNIGGNPVCPTLGVEDNTTTVFSLYPNPAKESTTITFSNDINEATISLYNIAGQLVQSYQPTIVNNSTMLDVSTFSAGIYVVSIHTNKGVTTKRLIIE